jgi:hypothetical protein
LQLPFWELDRCRSRTATKRKKSNSNNIIMGKIKLGFEVLTAVSTKTAVFWVSTRLHGATTQKTAIFEKIKDFKTLTSGRNIPQF